MKKYIVLLSSALLVLSSCGGETKGSSSSSRSSSSSSSPSSSSSSYSSSSSSSSVEVPSFVSYVAERASKYNGNISKETIMKRAGLTSSSIANEGNFIRALKAAFYGYLPKLTGQRKYGGVYTMPTITGDISDEAKSALEWLVSYGLWNYTVIEKDEWDYDEFVEKDFDEEEMIDETFMERLIKRFYMYFGTKEEDDFFAYNNHDFLYEGTDDTGITPSNNYKKSLMLNGENVKNNVITYANSLVEASDDDASLYKEALDYYEGTLDYSFLDDPLIKTQISYAKSIESLNGALQYAANSLSIFGGSILGCFSAPSFSYDGNYNVSTNVYVASTTAPFDVQSGVYDKEEVAAEVECAYKALGLSESEVTTYSTSLADFGRRCHNEYQDDKYDGKRGTHEYLYDTTTSKDFFMTNGVNIDLTSIFTGAQYTLTDLASCSTADAIDYLSYGMALVSATTEELQAISLYELYSANQNALSYAKGTAGDYDKFLAMIQNNLAYDYMNSDYYADSLATMSDIFTGIKRVFTNRLKSSSWLSDEGKKAISEKIAAIKSTLIGTCSDGSTLDYKALSTPSGLTLAATLGEANAVSQKGLIHLIAEGQIFDRSLLIIDGPFLSNAFYTPASNTINMTFGAIFSLALDRSKCTEERVMAKLGYIIGHEVTHGFDTSGVYFDKTGAYAKDGIIPKDDMTKFAALALDLEGLYKDQEVLPGLAQDPHTTITEDVADTGGLVFMEDLGKEKVSFNFKLFYEEMATGFGVRITRYRFKRVNLTDIHPFGRVRCNVLLSNSALFQKTFGIKEGDGMYLSSEEQVTIW